MQSSCSASIERVCPRLPHSSSSSRGAITMFTGVSRKRGIFLSEVLHPAPHYRTASAAHSDLKGPRQGSAPVSADGVHHEAVGSPLTPVGIHRRHVHLRVVALTSSGVQRRQHSKSAEEVFGTGSTVGQDRGGGGAKEGEDTRDWDVSVANRINTRGSFWASFLHTGPNLYDRVLNGRC